MDQPIRPMKADDIQRVFDIDCVSSPLYWPLRSYQFEVLENNNSYCLIYESEQVLCGFVVFWLILDEAHLANFAVHPDFRCRGIGEALVSAGLSALWDKGAQTSFLEVRETNHAAIHLYEKIGYQTVSIRKNYYQDTHESALNMNLEVQHYKRFMTRKDEINL